MISETIRQKLEEFIKNNYIDYNSLSNGKIHYSIRSVPPKTILENKAPNNAEKMQQPDLQKDTSSAPALEETISYSIKRQMNHCKKQQKLFLVYWNH